MNFNLRLWQALVLLAVIAQGAKAEGNLALSAKITTNLLGVSTSRLNDGIFAFEGSDFDSPEAVVTKDATAEFIVDFGKTNAITALLLQTDWNDIYRVSVSEDGQTWKEVWTVPTTYWGLGLRRRYVQFPERINAHFIRIRAGQNDGVLSLSEFQAYSDLPREWENLTAVKMRNTPMQWAQFLSVPHVEYLRMMIAAIVLMLSLWLLARREVNDWDKSPKLVRRSFAILVGVAACSWCNFFQFHWGSLIHRHDVFHYYFGAKYSPELGYRKLYECAVVADSEDGFLMGQVSTRSIRNLENNVIEPAAGAIANSVRCKNAFRPERWMAFKYDLSWFRQNMSRDDYLKVLKDHGYNATPFWNVAGYLISNLSSVSTLQLNLIALLDPLLLFIAFYSCSQVFGLWSVGFAITYFSTSYLASFAWTGGAFLRSDWLMFVLLGISFLKKEKFFKGGFFLCLAGLTRIFPFAFLVGVAIKIVADTFALRRLSLARTYRRIALGALTAVILMLPPSLWITGLENWGEFIQNTRKHFNTISTNMMGLDVVFSYAPKTTTSRLENNKLKDPFELWKEAKKQTAQERAPFSILFKIGFAVLIVIAISGVEIWEAAILGMGFVFFIRLSNYDYYFMAPLAFMWKRDPWAPVSLVIIAWLSWAIRHLIEPLDEQFFWASVLCLSVYLSVVGRLQPLARFKKNDDKARG